MAHIYPLIQTIAHVSAIIPLTPWETCAVNLVAWNRPSSVYFFCESSDACPSREFYRRVSVPTQTIFETETANLPRFLESDLVFLVADKKDIAWSNETIQKYRLGGKNDFKLVVVANMSEDPNNDIVRMGIFFGAMWKSGLVYSAVLLKMDTSAVIFTYIPFRSNLSCEDTSPVNLGECRAAVDSVFDPLHRVLNLNNCTIRGSVWADDRPFIEYPLAGRYSNMILEIGRRMNFSVEPIIYDDKTRPGLFCGTKEFEGPRGEVVAERAHFAIANFFKRECSQLEYIGPPYSQCSTWCTPILPGNPDVLHFLLSQFQTNVWIAIAITIFIIVIVVVLLCFLSQEQLSTSDAMNLAFVLFGSVPPYRFRTDSLKIVVAVWLLACLVLKAAYESESKSRSTTPIGSYIIKDLEDLADTKLRLCTTLYNKRLMENFEDPRVQLVNSNTKVCKGSFFEIFEEAHRKRNMAVMTTDLRCKMMSSDLSKVIPVFYCFTGGCLQRYLITPIATMRGFPFNRKWEDFMYRFTEAGLIEKWLDLQPLLRSAGYVYPFTLKHLVPSLLVLVVGCACGLISFLVEHVICKYFVEHGAPDLNKGERGFVI